MKSICHALAIGGLLTASLTATASCLDTARLTGVNLAGAEFKSSQLPGVANKDYTYPKDSELSFIAAQGATVIRLPFRWERIQQRALSPLDPAELLRLQNTVRSANAQGLCVILDIHNYAKYYGVPLKDNAALQAAFTDLWLRLAAVFNDAHSTAFGLMNEPSYLPISQWGLLSKRTLTALRRANSKNIILLGGGHWSGLHDWFSERDGVSNAVLFADLRDPLERTILEVHQYADQNYSGTGSECRSADQFNEKFERISRWARENRQQLFLGEFGMAASTECLIVLERFLSLMTDAPWKGWSYWAAGGWWGTYPFAINTSVTAPSAQWNLLKRYFSPRTQTLAPRPPMPLTTPQRSY